MSTSFDGLGAVLPPPITHILVIEGKSACLACRPRYIDNRADGIRHRVIHKRVRSVDKKASRDIGAATREDEGADGGGR